jgi:hypothetical protein
METRILNRSFEGSAVADLPESINLKQLLSESGYDVMRYEPLGLDVVFDSGNFNVFITCIDKLTFNSDNKTVSKCLLKASDKINFYNLFKHLSISLFAGHINSSEYISKNNKTVYLERTIDENDENNPEIELS